MKFIKYLLSFLLMFQLVACSITSTDQNEIKSTNSVKSTRAITSDYKVVGYMPSWSGSNAEIQYDKLTHINYSFLLPNADGSLQPIENPTKLSDLVTRGHANGVKVLIAVGGWNGGNDSAFETLAKDPALRTNFVNNMMNFVNSYNLDGVDIDWEYPDPGASGDAYTLLMTDLATALHAKGKLLTAAVVAQGYTGGGVQDAVFNVVDFLNLMAYDGGNGADHSPYSYAESTLNYWLGRGLPKEKAILGLPFYSRPGWMAYKVLVANNPLAPTTDFIDGQYYNGIDTIKRKTELGMQLGGGVMMWELSQDTNDSTSLLTAISEVIGGPIIPDNEKPTVPGNLTGTGSDLTATLSWTASTDNIGVTGYNIYTDGLNPVRVSNVTTKTLTDLNPGTYNYTVTALDRAGNESLASNSVTVTVTAPISNNPKWDPAAVYTGGMKVFHNNHDWEAKWWNQNQEPGKADVWKDLGIVSTENQAPTISISIDKAGVYLGDSVTITADASDDRGIVSVEFFEGATLLAAATAVPYTYVFTPQATGNYVLTAVVTDTDGVAVTSNVIELTVTTGPIITPQLKLVADKASYTEGETINLSVNLTNGETITVIEFFEGTSSLVVDNTSPYTSSLTATVGSFSFVAEGTDSTGNKYISNRLVIEVSPIIVGVNPWESGKLYKVGAEVTYDGFTWVNVREHTSNDAWYPGAPGLWFWEKK